MSKEVEGSAAEALPDDLPDADLKIILLGDSAVGKSKLVERYLMDEYNPRQLSTYALTLYRKNVKLDDTGEAISIDIWDTAGQESFNRMHPSYYYRSHCCIMVFDVTRKVTYQHLTDWYNEVSSFPFPIHIFSDVSDRTLRILLWCWSSFESTVRMSHVCWWRTRSMWITMSQERNSSLRPNTTYHSSSYQLRTEPMW